MPNITDWLNNHSLQREQFVLILALVLIAAIVIVGIVLFSIFFPTFGSHINELVDQLVTRV